MNGEIIKLILPTLFTSFIFTILLSLLSLKSYSRTGPKIQTTIEKHYQLYAIWAFLRLATWSFILYFLIAIPGPFALLAISNSHSSISPANLFISSIISSIILGGYLFLNQLLYLPSSLQISSQFRFSRLTPLWRRLTPSLISKLKRILIITIIIATLLNLSFLYTEKKTFDFYISLILTLASGYSIYFFCEQSEPRLIKSSNKDRANIIMIGTDTLRSDYISKYRNQCPLTPNIDKLSKRGLFFTNCITPLSRTAPSLASLFSGLWPHNHSIRDNYPHETNYKLPNDTLADILNLNGYQTSTISDWAGSDYNKIQFGFREIDAPQDQWNLKLLIRQGPGYLRLFLSLFTHNEFGKLFLPEIYYLAGIPLTSRLGRECRYKIAELSKRKEPLLINLFTSTTHVPFASEYPYYNLFTPANYKGDSRFMKSGLATPEQIIDSQVSDADSHDINQLLNLYDSCVKEFDDEVGKIIDYIDKCGLRENTFIVLYSDHGTDFFETECWGQGNTLVGNDPSGKIPLIISGPGVPQNVKFSHVCRSIDFMPTMLDLLGMEIPKNIDGVSLFPYLKDNSDPKLFAYQETGVWMGKIPGLHPDQITYPDIIELLTIPDIKSGTMVIDEKYYPTVIQAKNRSIQNDRWKLIYIPTYHGPVYQLYDLKTDPYKNVIDLYPDILSELKPKLEDWIFNPTIQ